MAPTSKHTTQRVIIRASFTMLSPRSFLFTRPSNPTSLKSYKDYHEESKSSKPRIEVGLRNEPREMSPTTSVTTSKTTTSDPVIIPVRSYRDSSKDGHRHKDRKERRTNEKHGASSVHRARDIHSPDSIPPSVAALLAITSIPPPKSKTSSAPRRTSAQQRLTVDAILKHTRVTEKEVIMSLRKHPLDLLLSSPEELEEEDVMGSDTGVESSFISSRTISTESVPSLDEGSIGGDSLSFGSPATPGSRRRRSTPTRRLHSLPSPPGETIPNHPLSRSESDGDDNDFKLLGNLSSLEPPKIEVGPVSPGRKFTFKSNLTASLKAIRHAARSLSSITTPMVIPDDFLTISIISLDPRVPFTDERRPPRLEDTPTPALRRYLNPTTNAPIEAHIPSSLAQTTSTTKCTASIQMQTYRVSKSSKTTSSNLISRRTKTSTPEEVFAEVAAGPVARQREFRENSDFIRIAVMEMMMRRHGKLDEKMPGRAKWTLPPRKMSNKAYEIGEGGIPVRWIPTTI